LKRKKALRDLSREEVAQELTRLAGSIADGSLMFEGCDFSFPDDLHLDWEVREEKGTFSLRLFLKGKKGLPTQVGTRYLKKKRPYEAKKLKKALGAQWKHIRRCIKDRCKLEDREQLLSLLSRYGRLSEPAWQSAWHDCTKRLVLLLDLMEQGDFKGSTLLAQEIERLIKSCHKKYK